MTLYLPNSKAMFIHIPKCGGTWVDRTLRALGLDCHQPKVRFGVSVKHSPLWAITNEYERAFTFVRDPLSWYESWYKFQVHHQWRRWEPDNWHPQRCLEKCQAGSFAGFIEKCLELESGYVTRLYDWYIPPVGMIVGRMETLADDLIRILRELGIEFDESVVRARGKENVSPVLECDWGGMKSAMAEAESRAITASTRH